MLTKKQKIAKRVKRVRLRVSGEKGQARPIFVFGVQRSGTNMLMKVLAASKEIECYNENDDEAFDNYVLRSNATIAELISKSYAKAVMFKSISDSQRANELLDIWPTTQGIWVYRRYPDVINSALRNFTEHNKYLYYILFEPETAGWRAENISKENMALVERYYNQGISDASARALIWYIRNDLYFQQRLDKDQRVRLLNYERIVSDSQTELKRILDFMGVIYEERLTDLIFSTSVNKHPSPPIDPDIQELCDQMYASLEMLHGQQQNSEH